MLKNSERAIKLKLFSDIDRLDRRKLGRLLKKREIERQKRRQFFITRNLKLVGLRLGPGHKV